MRWTHLTRGMLLIASVWGTIALSSVPAAAPASHVSYGLVIDNSPAVRSQLEAIIGMGKALLEANRPGDEAFVVRFANQENLSICQDLTADTPALIDCVDNLFLERGPPATIDALYLSVGYVGQHIATRAGHARALILMTGGEVGDSYYTLADLRAQLRGQQLPIYVVVFSGTEAKDLSLFDSLAESHGRVFKPRSQTESESAVRELLAAMRGQ